MTDLSIVFPAYNEEAFISKVLLDHYCYFSQRFGDKVELIVVIDGSSDRTPRIVSDISKQIPLTVLCCTEPTAKVGAVTAGFRQTKGAVVAFCDTDDFLSPQQLHKLIGPVQSGQVDCTISSRFLPESCLLNPGTDWHRLIDRYQLTNFFSRLLYGLHEIDVECGAKVFNARAREIWLAEAKAEHCCFDAEMLFLLRRAGLKIAEIPIAWTYVDKKATPNSRLARIRSVFPLLIQTIRIAGLLLYTRLQHVSWLAPHLVQIDKSFGKSLGFVKKIEHKAVQAIAFTPGAVDVLGDVPLSANVAKVLRMVTRIPAVKLPIQVMPDVRGDRWGMPAGIVFDSALVMPTAVRDIGCGYQLLHLPALGHSEIVELARQIRTFLSYDAPFRREYVQQFSIENILLEGMKYINALQLVSPSDFGFIERGGFIDNAEIDALEPHSFDVAKDYLGMFAEHFLEIRQIESIVDPEASRKLGINLGDLIVVIHAGSLGLRSEMYRLFYAKMAHYLMMCERDIGMTPQLIKRGLFAVRPESSLGRQFCGAARALMNYSYVNRFLVRNLLDELIERIFGPAHSLRLLSDLSHTSLDPLGENKIRHRRGVQQVHGYASPALSGYAPLQIGPPILLGGTRETPSFLFTSKREQTDCLCPHGSEFSELKWLCQRVKPDLSGSKLRQYVESAFFDTVPILKEKTLERNYINTLFVAQQMEAHCSVTPVCRIVPKLNLQIHGGGQMPLIFTGS